MMNEQRYLTVTALTRYIKKKFDVDKHLQDLWLKAELSNVKIHSRGHVYFTLKDETARIQGVMFAGNNHKLTFTPENGLKVLVRGEISVYEPYGQYQIYVNEMQPDGVGNLYLAFEQLKKRLADEGLFAEEKKKPIPSYPAVIGVVTSPTGAAIRDIFTTIKRRYPAARLIILPALVQGNGAAASIANAIEKANQLGMLDVIIAGRGGGSLEDLWPFNEEIVARAIFLSQVPIISAVGHETDYTIADFVADLRAPTPTGAAELAVPHVAELQERIGQRQMRLFRALKEKVTDKQNQLNRLQNTYAFRFPKRLYLQKEQELDKMLERLERGIKQTEQNQTDQLKQLDRRLAQKHPSKQFEQAEIGLKQVTNRLEKSLTNRLKQQELLFGQAVSKLNALNPLKVMERGYSLVSQEKGQLIKSITHVNINEQIRIRLKDGAVTCRVTGKEGDASDDGRTTTYI